jgi:hypothetical protein
MRASPRALTRNPAAQEKSTTVDDPPQAGRLATPYRKKTNPANAGCLLSEASFRSVGNPRRGFHSFSFPCRVEFLHSGMTSLLEG